MKTLALVGEKKFIDTVSQRLYASLEPLLRMTLTKTFIENNITVQYDKCINDSLGSLSNDDGDGNDNTAKQ